MLSCAEMDDRIQPGFGKAKIRVLVEQQASGKVIQMSVPGLELALPMRLPVRGSDPKFRFDMPDAYHSTFRESDSRPAGKARTFFVSCHGQKFALSGGAIRFAAMGQGSHP